jgi:hypothetical protein
MMTFFPCWLRGIKPINQDQLTKPFDIWAFNTVAPTSLNGLSSVTSEKRQPPCIYLDMYIDRVHHGCAVRVV